MKRAILLLVAIGATAAMLWLFGPRVAVDTGITFDTESIGADPDNYLSDAEAAYPDIREGQEKRIVWAYPASRARTPLAIVSIHGFSASNREIEPVPQRVAAALGANLYLARLSGHGRTGEAMAEASVNDWINDLAEAMAIGRLLGERVVVLSVSTGATLAAWGGTEPALSGDLAGIVMISPNFGVQASGAALLTMPFGGLIADLVAGKERSFTPANPLHAAYWTTRYPTAATLPMAALVELANAAPLEVAQAPVLVVYSDLDSVVRPEATLAAMARWGGPVTLETMNDSGHAANHVLAGDALSPGTTDRMVYLVTRWISSLDAS